MEKSNIRKVAVLADGCLGVFPEIKKACYEYVYREAAGVCWDESESCFKSTPAKNWDFSEWYQQIVCAVRSGLALQLVLCPETEYESDQEGFSDSIKLADQELWR